MREGACVAVLTVLAGVGSGGPVGAQQALQESVRSLPRPEFSPSGLELDHLLSLPGQLLRRTDTDEPRRPGGGLASFVALPRAQISVERTSNLFRTSDNETADVITSITPQLRVASDWTQHAVGLVVGANVGRHGETTREDFEDWRLGANARLDTGDDMFVTGLVAMRQDHEARGEVDDPGDSFGPTILRVLDAVAGAEFRRSGGVLVRPQYRHSRYRFDDNGSLDNSDRDRDEQRLDLRLGYETMPGTVVFIDPALSLRRYLRRFDDSGLQRDSTGYEALAGVNWDASGVTYVELAGGYFEQRFDDPGFSVVSGPIVRGRVVWNATPVLSVTGDVDRRLQETTVPTSAGTLETSVRLGFDWEVRHNLIASGSYGLRDQRFESVGGGGAQTHRIDLGLEWLINRFAAARVGVRQDIRRATDAADEHDATSVLFSLTGQL